MLFIAVLTNEVWIAWRLTLFVMVKNGNTVWLCLVKSFFHMPRSVIHVVVVCLPRPMNGKGVTPIFSYVHQLSVTTQAAGVVGTLNCDFSLYNSGIITTMVHFWTLRMAYYLYNVSFL